MTKIIKSFCTSEYMETDHELDIDNNQELVLTCQSNVGTENEPAVCGRFIKFPKGTSPEELKKFTQKHKNQNKNQVSLQKLEELKEELLKDF